MRRLSDALNKALVALKEELRENLHSVVAIGSASRPLEYVDGLSDIDIVAIVVRRPNTMERYKVLEGISGLRINVLFLRPDDVIEIIKSGYPLGWWLFYDSKVLYDDGTLERILKDNKPVVNNYTMNVLKKSSLTALSLAAENYFLGYLTEGINWLHRSLRYGAQWLLAHSGSIPSSDLEITEALKKIELPPIILTCFQDLIAVRRRGRVTNWTLRLLINTTVRALCLIYDISHSDWALVEMKIREATVDGTLTKISAVIDEDRLKWIITLFKCGSRVEEVIE